MTIRIDSNSSPPALVEPIYREIPAQHSIAPVEGALELSIVMPCLNEADTVGTCVEKAMRILREHQIAGEVIVADNGSVDGSSGNCLAPRRPRRPGRVQRIRQRADGRHRGGPRRFVLMGDADDSYDFLETPKFLDRLREGYDMVQGCRLPRGGGVVRPGAMPFLHRWWGNPMFSIMAATMFNAPIHDIYCGMRRIHQVAV